MSNSTLLWRAAMTTLIMFPIWLISTVPTAANDDLSILITGPQPYQVIQWVGFDAAAAAKTDPGSPAFGSAQVDVSGTLPEVTPVHNALEYRIMLMDGGEGRSTDWVRLTAGSISFQDREFHATVTVPAGE